MLRAAATVLFFSYCFVWLLLQQGACHAKLRAVAIGNLKVLSLVQFSDFFLSVTFIMCFMALFTRENKKKVTVLFISPYQETILTFYFICSRSIDII